MTDKYRITDARPPEAEERPNSSGTDMLLWIVLVAALAGNGILSVIGLDLLAIPLGAVVVLTGITLAVRFFQRRA
ncbi:hypothetical protein [Glycomyces tarimensis]